MATREPPAFENADKCRKCSTAFSLFTRKHHCRNCGRTFCGACSTATMPLPHFGLPEPVRVCGQCEQTLKNPPKAAPAASAAAAKPAAAASAESQRRESLLDVPAPVAKKVSKCTCNSPLCICPPDPEEKVVPETRATVTPAKRAAVSSPPPSGSTPVSTFLGFGGAHKASVTYDLKGDLNEQVREAVKAGDLDGVKQLLGAGATARYVDRTGNTLAHLAAMFNRFDLIELLVKHGADLWVKNPSKETPVDLAPPALQRKMRELQPHAVA